MSKEPMNSIVHWLVRLHPLRSIQFSGCSAFLLFHGFLRPRLRHKKNYVLPAGKPRRGNGRRRALDGKGNDRGRISVRRAGSRRTDGTAEKRIYRLALPVQLRRGDSARYPGAAARHNHGLRLQNKSKVRAAGHHRPALRPADSAVSAADERRLRLDGLALHLRLRRRGGCAAAPADLRLPQKLRLSQPSAAEGLRRQAVFEAAGDRIRRKAEWPAPLALPLRLRE